MSKNNQVVQKQQIDRGVLRIFRICVVFLWGAQSLFLLTIGRAQEPGSITLFNWVLSSLYCVYLSSSRLQRTLGQHYLPIALFLASVGPVISQVATTALWLHSGLPNSLIRMVYPQTVYTGQLLPLLLPLLLISTQYGLRVLFCFTSGTTALSMIQVFLLISSDRPTMIRTLIQILLRFLIFSVAGTIIVLLSDEKRKQQRELSQKNAQLTHYAIILEQLAVSRERNRIARELHDTLAHTLSALNIQLKALEVLWQSNPQKAGTMIKQMQKSTHEGLQEARSALQALRISPLEDLGLVLALKQLAEQSAAWASMALDLKLPAHVNGISHEVELQLYRIAEEALTNVTRHSHATHISLHLQQDQLGIVLTITDDGDGFDTTMIAKNGHYGLIGMRERAALIDATLELRSRPRHGTSVQLRKAVKKEKA